MRAEKPDPGGELYAGETEPVIQLTPEEEADLAEANRGAFAGDEEIRAIFARLRT